jgi:hypothetical protein
MECLLVGVISPHGLSVIECCCDGKMIDKISLVKILKAFLFVTLPPHHKSMHLTSVHEVTVCTCLHYEMPRGGKLK